MQFFIDTYYNQPTWQAKRCRIKVQVGWHDGETMTKETHERMAQEMSMYLGALVNFYFSHFVPFSFYWQHFSGTNYNNPTSWCQTMTVTPGNDADGRLGPLGPMYVYFSCSFLFFILLMTLFRYYLWNDAIRRRQHQETTVDGQPYAMMLNVDGNT